MTLDHIARVSAALLAAGAALLAAAYVLAAAAEAFDRGLQPS